MPSRTFLEVQHLTQMVPQAREQTILLKEISYQFQKGCSYGLMGTSGSGKSTLLAVLSGFEAPTYGHVLLEGKDLYGSSSTDRLAMRRQLGVVFQIPYLINEFTLLENIMIKGLIDHHEYREASEKALYLLAKVGLAGKESQSPRSLSGGEQQRACIARALFSEPSFIIADEPTAHLDEINARLSISVLLDYQKENHSGLLIATHDPIVLGMLDTTLQLEAGTLSPFSRGSYKQRAMIGKEQESDD
jgi:ABC-type lipoprotein export system ATPase subunit